MKVSKIYAENESSLFQIYPDCLLVVDKQRTHAPILISENCGYYLPEEYLGEGSYGGESENIRTIKGKLGREFEIFRFMNWTDLRIEASGNSVVLKYSFHHDSFFPNIYLNFNFTNSSVNRFINTVKKWQKTFSLLFDARIWRKGRRIDYYKLITELCLCYSHRIHSHRRLVRYLEFVRRVDPNEFYRLRGKFAPNNDVYDCLDEMEFKSFDFYFLKLKKYNNSFMFYLNFLDNKAIVGNYVYPLLASANLWDKFREKILFQKSQVAKTKANLAHL